MVASSLTWTGFATGAWGAGVSVSLSDSSLLLLLTEFSSCLPTWVAVGTVFPMGAGGAPFLGGSLAGAEAGVFPVGFTLRERKNLRDGV